MKKCVQKYVFSDGRINPMLILTSVTILFKVAVNVL